MATNLRRHAIKGMLGRNPSTQQQVRRANVQNARDMKRGELKQDTAQTFNRYQAYKQAGRDNKASLLKDKLSAERHVLTKRLLGTSAARAHLGDQGSMRQSTRTLLKARLGDKFGNYYYTGGKRKKQNIGTVRTPKYTGPGTNGRKIGPPAQR